MATALNHGNKRCVVLLLNCDNTCDLKQAAALFKRNENVAQIREVKWKLSEKQELSEKLKNRELSQLGNTSDSVESSVPLLGVFVVHAHESRLNINEESSGVGYYQVYQALKTATDDHVLIIIQHDENSTRENLRTERYLKSLSNEIRRKLLSQFDNEHFYGPLGFIVSWNEKFLVQHHIVAKSLVQRRCTGNIDMEDVKKEIIEDIERENKPISEKPNPHTESVQKNESEHISDNKPAQSSATNLYVKLQDQCVVLLMNCDDTCDLQEASSLFHELLQNRRVLQVRKFKWRLEQMEEFAEKLENGEGYTLGEVNGDDSSLLNYEAVHLLGVFVVNALESRIVINVANSPVGYYKIFQALLKATGNRVLTIIQNDANSDEFLSSKQPKILSTEIRQKLLHQFDKNLLSGPNGFAMSWHQKSFYQHKIVAEAMVESLVTRKCIDLDKLNQKMQDLIKQGEKHNIKIFYEENINMKIFTDFNVFPDLINFTALTHVEDHKHLEQTLEILFYKNCDVTKERKYLNEKTDGHVMEIEEKDEQKYDENTCSVSIVLQETESDITAERYLTETDGHVKETEDNDEEKLPLSEYCSRNQESLEKTHHYRIKSFQCRFIKQCKIVEIAEDIIKKVFTSKYQIG